MLVRKNILSLTVFCLALCFAGLSCVTAQGLHTVVIDAGHGSTRFPGARYGNVCEKDINLKVALRLGALIEKNMPSVKVIYTRKVDKNFSSDLRTDLQARADIANRASGDLFISIHSNASRNTAVRGVETLIMGESSLETRVNEETLFAYNKDEVMDMSDEKTAALVRAYIQNLQFTYGEYSEAMARFIQKQYVKLGRHNRGVRKQPLRVLYATDMPSVLTEIGFMSNPTELKYITSEKGQSEIANAIYAAVKEYDALLRRTSLADTTPQSQEPAAQPSANVAKPSAAKPSEAKPASVKYAVQILASDRKLDTSSSRFKSYRGKVAVVRGQGALP
ncbi:MAG: N-acetylmuramoyl-L-alanine amidase, partial [Alistipes sp.]|nr:N-acetylmuramoyl-L-alanine amidase [Alistipes sp.]